MESGLLVNTEILDKAGRLFRVLGDPTRLSILYLLENQELNVGKIASLLGLEQSVVSHQLKTLKTARLVKSRRSGKTMLYSQIDDHVYVILNQVLTHIKE